MESSEDEFEPQPLPLTPTPTPTYTLKAKPAWRGAGFVNRGNTCYLGATLQLLLHVPAFREWLMGCKFASGSIGGVLADICKSWRSQQTVDPEPLLRVLYLSENKSKSPGELLCLLLELLGDQNNNSGIYYDIGGSIELYDKCQVCQEISHHTLHDSVLYPIHLDSCQSIQFALAEYGTPYSIDQFCCNEPLLRFETITKAPAVLMLKVESRSSTEGQGNRELSLDVSFGGSEYRLIGFLLQKSENYYSVIVNNGNTWVQYNDASVAFILPHKLLFCNSVWSQLDVIVYQRQNIVKSIGSPVHLQHEHNCDDVDEFLFADTEALSITDVPLDWDQQNSDCIKDSEKKWIPTLPNDLSQQIIAADFLKLEVYDPILKPEDVPGAEFPDVDFTTLHKAVLQRWLECRGLPKSGNKTELIDRIQCCIDNKMDSLIDSSVDNMRWYNAKRQKVLDENPNARHPLLPLQGWDSFPSVDIPLMFNWGHAHVYLVENAPNWSAGFEDIFSDSDEEIFSQDIAECVGQTNIARKGERFLNSGHIIEVQDTMKDGYYFIKARIKASMRSTVYFCTLSMNAVSGSIRECTCNCAQQALGRCSHVAALLLYLDKHTQTKGYGALSCTDRQQEWGKGAVEKDPGLLNKVYHDSTNPLRSTFDPTPTSETNKTKEELVKIKDNFLKNVQRLYVTEECDDNDREYLFDLHLEFHYEPYDEDAATLRITIDLCKQFSHYFRQTDQKGPFLVPNTDGQHDNVNWQILRGLHFCASLSSRLMHLTEAGYKGFLRSHLWNLNKFGGNFATRYGTKNEEKARAEYQKWRTEQDPTAIVKQTGMWKNPKYMEFECSLDALVTSSISPTRIAEFKCPLLVKNGNPLEFEKTLNKNQMKRFCLTRNSDGSLQLKDDHQYWHQMQMQLGIMELQECDFVVWSSKGMFVQTIKFDPQHWVKVLIKLIPLYYKLMVPEYFLMRTPRNLEPFLLHYKV